MPASSHLSTCYRCYAVTLYTTAASLILLTASSFIHLLSDCLASPHLMTMAVAGLGSMFVIIASLLLVSGLVSADDS